MSNPGSMKSVTLKYVDINRVRIAYRDRGIGDPVVLIHGSLAGLHTFQWQLDPLASEHRVIAYSRRFHPPSSDPPPGAVYDMHQHVDDLHALISRVCGQPVHLVGSSYGAYVALMLATRYPAAVRSLVLGEPPILRFLLLTQDGRAALDRFRHAVLEPARLAFERDDMEDGARKFVDGVRGQKGAFDAIPHAGRADLLKYAPELSLELTADFDRYMPPVDDTSLQSLPHRTLLLTGERSPDLFRLIIDHLERRIPHSQRSTIRDAGHAMHATKPNAYNETLLTFLKSRRHHHLPHGE